MTLSLATRTKITDARNAAVDAAAHHLAFDGVVPQVDVDRALERAAFLCIVHDSIAGTGKPARPLPRRVTRERG